LLLYNELTLSEIAISCITARLGIWVIKKKYWINPYPV
jgi:hypothetical protein